jgi:tRNA (guanine26-N2/guanine27-N2)-dimethyltransferase
MYSCRANPQKQFDVIDLDPYGSAVEFLDGAVQAVKNGGMLLVTCTDLAVLCGNHPEVCCVKYGATPIKAKYCHEVALRILLQFIERTANKYRRHMIPLISVSVDFYIRVFVRIVNSAAAMKDTPKALSMIYQCAGCETFHLQPLGKQTVDDRGVVRYQPATVTVPSKCTECGRNFILGGPIWNGPLYDETMIDNVLDYVKEHPKKFGTEKRIIGKLTVMKEELKDAPLFVELDSMCYTLHMQTPSRTTICDAITKLGYHVSTFHDLSSAIKTDMPFDTLWDIFRAICKEQGI